jgi:3-phosphoshikimate 1-carboxyvinyltransferase
MSRPISELAAALNANGGQISVESDRIAVRGRLRPGVYELPGDVSSQYYTGLFFALPLLGGSSRVVASSALQSKSYLAVTRAVLRDFGVDIAESERGFGEYIVAPQRFVAPDEPYAIEADWSQAAVFLCAAALGADCAVTGVRTASPQGDSAILGILEQAGCEIVQLYNSVTEENDTLVSPTEQKPRIIRSITVKTSHLCAANFDAGDIPDIVPPLAAMLCFADGESVISNCARLRLKESDRLAAVCEGLRSLGADIEIDGGSLRIRGKPTAAGGTVDSRGDHRIAMMAAVASLRCASGVYVTDAGCVAKSYPNFWNDWEGKE